jgi:uncharacterized ParB-like nuclease family protein
MASTSKVLESNTEDITSIHAGLIEEVHDVPMTVLIRPFPLEVDEDKVHSIMKTLQVRSIVFHYVLIAGNFVNTCMGLHDVLGYSVGLHFWRAVKYHN